MAASERFTALDGLRGWAALSVVIFHYSWETFGPLDPVFRSLPASFFGDGQFAVSIFFLISGYVLTRARWNRADNGRLPLVLVRRYLRLTIPITAASLIVFVLMSLKLTPTQQAADALGRQNWFGEFANYPPDFLQTLWFSTVAVYWRRPPYSYGPFLWTMAVELIGSVIVLSLSQRLRQHWFAYLALLILIGVLLFGVPMIACFPIGALVALLQADGAAFRKPAGSVESGFATAVLIACLPLAAWTQINPSSRWTMTATSVVFFLAAMRSAPAQRLLSSAPSRWMGSLSFPLYLVQYPVLISVAAGLITTAKAGGWLTPWSALGISVVCIGLTIAAAWLFMPVERFTLRIIQQIAVRRPLPATGAA